MHREAFKLYRLFVLSKAFLASNDPEWTYIFQKYRYGYSKIKFKTFEAVPMKHYFYAFAKKGISDEKFVRLCMCAHTVRGQKFWIYDLVSEEVLSFYLKIQTYIESFKESSWSELKSIDISYDILLRKGINYPKLLELYIQKKLSLPLLLAFERTFNILEKWDRELDDKSGIKFIWDSYYRAIKKWNGFFFDGEIPEIAIQNDIFSF